MASGDVTEEQDERLSGTHGAKPVCGLTLEIVVAINTSEKEESLSEVDHKCMNCLLTGIYFNAPLLVTADKTVRLELKTGVDEIYKTGDLDATSAANHARHTQRALMGTTKIKVVCDHDVGSAKTFKVKLRGI